MEMLPCFMHYFHPCFFALFSSHRLIHLFWVWTSLKLAEDWEESVELCAQQGNYYTRRKWTKKVLTAAALLAGWAIAGSRICFVVGKKRTVCLHFFFVQIPIHTCAATHPIFPEIKEKEIREKWNGIRLREIAWPTETKTLGSERGKRRTYWTKLCATTDFPFTWERKKNAKKIF